LIGAPPGWTLLEADLSQIELRIAAELAKERTMLDAFQRGIDTHWLTAMSEIERGQGLAELVLDTARTWKQNKKLNYGEAIEVLLEMGPDAAAEINKEWKEIRKKAKAINFGYLYGMWWKKFKLYARDNYGVVVTDEQAEESRDNFFSKYPGYPDWHKNQGRLAQQNGYVKTLSGRKRRLPKAMAAHDTPERREALRQAINSPVQSFANEINLMAALQLREEFGRKIVRICGTVHDAILVRVKNEHMNEVGKRLLEIMTGPKLFKTLNIKLSVPILAEAKVGDWGVGKDFHKWQKENGYV
jgi:DNA polymerase-1